MNAHTIHVTILTPVETVCEIEASSVRVPTTTGQVGVRPNAEASVLAIEPGLVRLISASGTKYAATVGGLLRYGRNAAQILTPFAVVGDDVTQVNLKLDEFMATPSDAVNVRRTLGLLETRILQELSSDSGVAHIDPHAHPPTRKK